MTRTAGSSWRLRMHFLSENPTPEQIMARLKKLSESPNKAAAAAAKTQIALRTEPLDLKFTALDGREVDLAKLRGKVVLVDFWATWCIAVHAGGAGRGRDLSRNTTARASRSWASRWTRRRRSWRNSPRPRKCRGRSISTARAGRTTSRGVRDHHDPGDVAGGDGRQGGQLRGARRFGRIDCEAARPEGIRRRQRPDDRIALIRPDPAAVTFAA